MMSRGNVVFLAIVIAVALIAVAAASVLHDGVSSRAKPTALETMMAREVRHMAISASARSMQNRAAETPENLRDARLHFADHCAICHANDGSGDTPIGRNLYPKPPDLRREETQKLADGELFWIIENGVRFTGMPAFGEVPIPPKAWEELEASTRAAGQKGLKALLARARKAGVRVRGVLLEGIPHEQIVRAAKRRRADVLVMGTHGRTGLARFFLGSVTARVVATSTCPVLTVRGR